MAEQATSPHPEAASRNDGDIAALQAELDRSREEVLRLRDLLIGKDVELGQLRGRLAENEAGAGRLLALAHRLQAAPMNLLWKVVGLLRGRGGKS
jgi:hypothetical protein